MMLVAFHGLPFFIAGSSEVDIVWWSLPYLIYKNKYIEGILYRQRKTSMWKVERFTNGERIAEDLDIITYDDENYK